MNQPKSDVPYKEYYVIMYDMKWYEEGMDIKDMSISQPAITDEFDSLDEAKAKADEYNSTLEDNVVIDIKLRNGQQYKGKRFVFTYYKGEN